ncbi:Dbl homology domain-containing protein, partial [Russula brevipes]
TWLSTISSSAYHSLLDRYGEVEIKRQQIIWDLCETERAFVRQLQTFVRLFICPLRMKDSVTWLAGIPTEVARLFDWLEDIINLHTQISSALRAIVSEQYPIVMRIAGRVRSFVSRLEVHQPYVVRLESATLLIKRLSGESNSDFGEFIRIQQELDECQGWSVEAFLVEPVNRLVDYPIHFKV